MQTTVEMKTLVDRVRTNVPGCPTPAIITALREAAISLCETAKLWEYDMAAVGTEIGKATYRLVYPDDAYPLFIRRGLYEPSDDSSIVEIKPKTEQELERIYGPTWLRQSGDPLYRLHRGDQSEVVLVPTPDTSVAASLQFTLVLKPARDATRLPEFLVESHWQALSSGALAILQAQPNVEWRDVDRAAINADAYDSAEAKAVNQKLRNGNSRARSFKARYPLA